MRIVVEVGGNVSVFRVDERGQYHDAVLLNSPSQSIHSVIRRYWGADNTLIVHDSMFETGYHSVITGCSAGGHGWTFRLEPLFSSTEDIEAHSAMARQALAGVPVTAKPGIVLAFERLEAQYAAGKR